MSINLNELNFDKSTEDVPSKKVVEYYFYPNQFKMAAEQIMIDNFCCACDRGMDDEDVEYLELDTFRDLGDFDIQIAINESELYQLLQEEYVSLMKKRKERMQRLTDDFYNLMNHQNSDKPNT